MHNLCLSFGRGRCVCVCVCVCASSFGCQGTESACRLIAGGVGTMWLTQSNRV